MNRQYNTGIRCNTVQSGVTTSGQVYQVLSDNMSSTSVRYQVSSVRCQVSGAKYKYISVG